MDEEVATLLAAVRALKRDERYEDYLSGCRELVKRYGDDVDVRMEAAFAHDAFGSESDALVHYEVAAKMERPREREKEFLLGYGSTLRNTGNIAESLRVLKRGMELDPSDRSFRVFYALALHSAGRNGEALADLLDLVLSLSEYAPDLEAYERAIAYYRDNLRELAKEPK